MSKSNSRSGCFKVGCFGCLGTSAIVVGFFVLVGIQQLARQSGESTVERREVVQVLPRLPELQRLVAVGEIGEGVLELGERAGPLARGFYEREEIASAVGRIELRLDLGEFEIEPAPPGEDLSVDARIDTGVYELDEELSEEEDGTWSYRLAVRPKGGTIGMLLRGGGNSSANRVTVRLPRGRPFDLTGWLGVGSSKMDLGGLMVRRLDLIARVGEHAITFSEPLPAPMETFSVRKSIGELSVSELGNASPGTVEIGQQIGELRVDLGGPWVQDSSIRIHNSIGELSLELPQDARILVDRASVGIGERNIRLPSEEDLSPDAPTLRLDISGSLGEVRAD